MDFYTLVYNVLHVMGGLGVQDSFVLTWRFITNTSLTN